ncbi:MULTISPECIES: hypothetical protein [Proteus]|nr:MULTISPECIES: hypothetical protein [Proteus]MBG2976966.1 hypothetical protein [Proteus mirabilis]MBG3092728.1 hypothetical protein [Proteus mirabilis]MBI6357961.1 hypothetical protein [Proteus mirabilis]MBI6395645.1 hypothetical protein [Proteus mirabilis]MBI6456577.1 hypothetical protein [Proteus mirabilis]
MKEYPEYVDNTIIKWYESDIISDFKMPIPDENKDDLDKAGCFFDSNVWNETLSEKEVVQTLIFNDDMRFIWSSLSKRANEFRIPYIFYYILTHKIIDAYSGPNDWELLTQKQKEEKMAKIKKLSFELCKEISNTPLDLSVMSFANYKSFFERFNMIVKNDIQKNLECFLNRYCEIKNSHYIPKNGDDRVIGAAWAGVGVMSPSIGSVLQTLSEKADSFKCESILKRKNQVRRVFFIRKLSMFFTETFGTPLHNITATISGVFLKEDISIEEVRSVIR